LRNIPFAPASFFAKHGLNLVWLQVWLTAPWCYSTAVFLNFFWQWGLPQMFALLMETCAMIQLSILLQPHRTVVANFVPGNFGLFRRNLWQSLVEPSLKNTALQTTAIRASRSHEYCWWFLWARC